MVNTTNRNTAHYLALTGGVGGAKLALGLTRILDPAAIAFVVNTGDDFDHLGLRICPDLDTLMYTLAGKNNPETGWGRRDETWQFIGALAELGGESWFRLGDRDLAVHLTRTHALAAGDTLTAVTARLNKALGVLHPVLPMTDQRVATVVHTSDGPLAFQHYFVKERCAPAVTGFHFHGASDAKLNPAVEARLDDPALAGVILCPSNPFVSVDPILAIPGIRARLARLDVPVIAVSPIVGGAAIKGPTAKMMSELGMPIDACGVAKHYMDFLDAFVLDHADSPLERATKDLGLVVSTTNTVMVTLDDRIELARHCIDLLTRLGR